MAQYIDKGALVAEIERLREKNNKSENVYDFGTEHALKSILSFIDTLELKEVGIDKEIGKFFGELWHLGLEKDWDKVSYIVYYENKNSFVQRKAKDPIDACIEMIDWLIKNGQKLLSK